jgi:hypothetical protein
VWWQPSISARRRRDAAVRTGFRFRPPEVETPAELRWVASRAFGPPGGSAEDVAKPDPVGAVRVAERLELAPRIAARIDRARLTLELGEGAADRLMEGHRAAAASALAAEEICRRVAEVARAIDLPVVATKGAAMSLLGIGVLGARTACDVDLMTSSDGVHDLQGVLVEAGFREEPVRAAEQQLAPLHHATGLLVELHRMLRGVRIDGRRSATAADLVEHHLLDRAEGGPDNLYLPDRDVLLSHVMVHGIAQHGAAPRSYPLFRMVADVQDFDLDSRAWQRFLDRSWPWIGASVSRGEVTSAWQLARRFADGDGLVSILAEGAEPSLMLRHLIAGEFDPEYQRSLRVVHITDPLASSSRIRTLLGKVHSNLWQSRERLERLYGRPRSPAGYAGLRLRRLIDLVVQALDSLWAGWRLRRRGK